MSAQSKKSKGPGKTLTKPPVLKFLPSQAYELYRNTPVGNALFDTVQEMLDCKHIKPSLASIVVTQFDLTIRKIINEINTLSARPGGFRFEGELLSYR